MSIGRPLRWVLWSVAGMVALALAGLAAVWLTSTRAGPLPDEAPGYRMTQIPAPHRDRPLELHLWYPATADAPVALVGQNALFYGFHGRPSATGDGKAHPLIVLSHGSGGNALRLGWLASALAARGMIVAAVNHPGTTSGDSRPDRTVMPWERAADVTAVLDALLAAAPDGIRPDPARIGVVGFSLGGATAMLVSGARLSKDAFLDHCAGAYPTPDCTWLVAGGLDLTTIDAARYEAPMGDPRIAATVVVDPALHQSMTPDSLAAVKVPLLVVNLGGDGAIPTPMRAEGLAAAVPGAAFAAIEGAAHFSFLARCSSFGVFVIGVAGDDNICSDNGLRDRVEVQADLSALIGDFLDGALAVR